MNTSQRTDKQQAADTITVLLWLLLCVHIWWKERNKIEIVHGIRLMILKWSPCDVITISIEENTCKWAKGLRVYLCIID